MTVSIEMQNDVAVIEIDDGKKNVINHDVLDQLETAFDKAEADGTRAILFRCRRWPGPGPLPSCHRIFCSPH